MPAIPRTASIVRRVTGRPLGSWPVPARTPLLIERYQVLFDTVSVPPLPAPVFMVQIGGKPIAYRSTATRTPRRSIPGLVTLQPRGVHTEVFLRGAGEACMVYFHDEKQLPAWATRMTHTEPVTFANEVIAALTQRLMQVIDANEGSSSYRRTLGNALLAELEYEVTRAMRAGAARVPATRGALRVAHTAMRYIDAHLAEPLGVAALARVCGLGATSFSAQFHGATGESPHRHVRRKRIERACELLRTTALSVREVGELVGYAGQSHFCVAFSRERGMSPSQYRQASRP